jgi:hypothetical protein
MKLIDEEFIRVQGLYIVCLKRLRRKVLQVEVTIV